MSGDDKNQIVYIQSMKGHPKFLFSGRRRCEELLRLPGPETKIMTSFQCRCKET